MVPDSIDTRQKYTVSLLDGSEEFGLEINPEKTRYMLMTHYQKAEQKQSKTITNRSFEDL
jgi:hypothetical protein